MINRYARQLALLLALSPFHATLPSFSFKNPFRYNPQGRVGGWKTTLRGHILAPVGTLLLALYKPSREMSRVLNRMT